MLKAAVQAFKDARQKVATVESSKNASEEKHSQDALCSKDGASKSQQEGAITSEQKKKPVPWQRNKELTQQKK